MVTVAVHWGSVDVGGGSCTGFAESAQGDAPHDQTTWCQSAQSCFEFVMQKTRSAAEQAHDTQDQQFDRPASAIFLILSGSSLRGSTAGHHRRVSRSFVLGYKAEIGRWRPKQHNGQLDPVRHRRAGQLGLQLASANKHWCAPIQPAGMQMDDMSLIRGWPGL